MMDLGIFPESLHILSNTLLNQLLQADPPLTEINLSFWLDLTLKSEQMQFFSRIYKKSNL